MPGLLERLFLAPGRAFDGYLAILRMQRKARKTPGACHMCGEKAASGSRLCDDCYDHSQW